MRTILIYELSGIKNKQRTSGVLQLATVFPFSGGEARTISVEIGYQRGVNRGI